LPASSDILNNGMSNHMTVCIILVLGTMAHP